MDYLIMERRRLEERRQDAEEMLELYNCNDLKNEWEKNTDRKIQHNMVKRKVQGLLQAKEFSVDERRER